MANQGRSHHNLIFPSALMLLVKVHDGEVVVVFQVGLADGLEIGDGATRPRRAAGDVKPQNISVPRRQGLGGGRQNGYPTSFFSSMRANGFDSRVRRSRPTKTRSVLDRLPMIFRIGEGSLRTSVGNGESGRPRRAEDFSSNRSPRCGSGQQGAHRRAAGDCAGRRADFGVGPAT